MKILNAILISALTTLMLSHHATAAAEVTYDSEMIAQACKVYPEVARTLRLAEDIYDDTAWNIALERGKNEVLATRAQELNLFYRNLWTCWGRPIITTTSMWELLNPFLN